MNKLCPLGILVSSLPMLAGCTGVSATEKKPPTIDLVAPIKTEKATFALG